MQSVDLVGRVALLEAALTAAVERIAAEAEHRATVERLMREHLAVLQTIAARLPATRGSDTEALRTAVESYFGPGPFTAGGLVDSAEDDGDLADALGRVIDCNRSRHARVTQLGLLLRDLPWLEVVGDSRGAMLYRLRA